jgi:hypothetical protein
MKSIPAILRQTRETSRAAIHWATVRFLGADIDKTVRRRRAAAALALQGDPEGERGGPTTTRGGSATDRLRPHFARWSASAFRRPNCDLWEELAGGAQHSLKRFP